MQLDVVRELLVENLPKSDRLEALVFSAIYLKVVSCFVIVFSFEACRLCFSLLQAHRKSLC